jgi:hypothetical protein
MALMLMGFEVDNYDEWKQLFDSDPGGRKAVAKGHRLSRSVEQQYGAVPVTTRKQDATDSRAVSSNAANAHLSLVFV